MYVLGAGLEFADFGGRDSGIVDGLDNLFGGVGVDDDDHADAHIESSVHIGIGDFAKALDGFKNGEGLPGPAIDFCLHVEGQDTGEIIV